MMLMKTYMTRIQRLNDLIRTKATGTPAELAKKLEISERRLFQHVDFMKKELNAPILYSETLQTYYYSVRGEIKFFWNEFKNGDQSGKNKKK